jgi:hypothetical protein
MKSARLVLPGLVVIAFVAVSCQTSSPAPSNDEAADPPWFRDVTEEVGLHFVHDAGRTGDYFYPGLTGSGAALFDFDGDGLLDVYLLQNGGPDSQSTNRLFHQEPDGMFKDVSAGSGLDVAGFGQGVAVGDVNNDGLPDVLITEYGRVRLFLNNGNGTFADVTKQAGLDNPLWGASAAFLDYDRDGWLDLVIVNYLDYDPKKACADNAGKPDFCGPHAFAGTVAKLYHNLGRQAGDGPNVVRFEDVTVKSGLAKASGPGLGVVCLDFNGDHWPDILIANDGFPNHLWINQRNGKFEEEGVFRGVAYNAMGRAQGNMGIAVGDVDGDRLFDLVITHLPDELPACWMQGPVGQFHDRTTALGLATHRWRGTGFGAVLADFDQDGALDLALVNGAVKRPGGAAPVAGDFWAAYGERNQLFANDGTGRFRDVSPSNRAFCGTPNVARGLAVGDLNGDGAPDLLVTCAGAPARMYRNVASNRGHWLLVRTVDAALGGRDAYGAEATVHAGGRSWKRWLNPASSYLCSNDPRAHFGLGRADRVDSIEVVWPDGTVEDFRGGPVDERVTLRKGEGRPHAP